MAYSSRRRFAETRPSWQAGRTCQLAAIHQSPTKTFEQVVAASPVVVLQTTSPDRFFVLDSLRGVCAIAVCLFHFRASGPIATSDFVRGSWIFVDFFFVLSGFVITANYRTRLENSSDIFNYVVLRLARVWPLHAVLIIVFLITEVVGYTLYNAELMQRLPFSGDKPLYAVFTNLTFTQIFGIEGRLTWNQPAWSIAAEFWTYILFAGICAFGGRYVYAILLALVIGASLALALTPAGHIGLTHNGSVLRCAFGFASGALAWALWDRCKWQAVKSDAPINTLDTALEIAVVALVVMFVSNVGIAPANLAAPLVFAASVLVFAHQRGALSRALQAPYMIRLGVLSYSIYMVHTFVQSRFDDVLRLLGSATGTDLVTRSVTANGRSLALAGSSATQGIVFTVLMLGLVILTASLTCKYIEQPTLASVRGWLRRRKPA